MTDPIRDIVDRVIGPTYPYGVAIREAIATGDTVQMQSAAADANRWLAENPGHPATEDVRAALVELEAAMSGL